MSISSTTGNLLASRVQVCFLFLFVTLATFNAEIVHAQESQTIILSTLKYDLPSTQSTNDPPPSGNLTPKEFVTGHNNSAQFLPDNPIFIAQSACILSTTGGCQVALSITITASSVANINIPGSLPPGIYTLRITFANGRFIDFSINVKKGRLLQWVHGMGEDYAQYWNIYADTFFKDRVCDYDFQHYPTFTNFSNGALNGRVFEYGFTSAESISKTAEALYTFWNKPTRLFQEYDDATKTSSFHPFRYELDGNGFPPIMIGHSMGGLVARAVAGVAASTPTLNPSAGQVAGIITVGTPNRGAPVIESIQNGTAANYLTAAAQHIAAGSGYTLLSEGLQAIGAAAGLLLNVQNATGYFLANAAITQVGTALTVGSVFPTSWIAPQLFGNLDNQIGVRELGRRDMNPSSAFMQSIQNTPVPVISIYGKVSTSADHPEWRLASTSVLARQPSRDRDALGLLATAMGISDLAPQYQALHTANDAFVPTLVRQVVEPLYWVVTALYTTQSVLNFISGNIPLGIWRQLGLFNGVEERRICHGLHDTTGTLLLAQTKKYRSKC
jgi:pimeloyl-ACP methyl ester carboxylesterase